MTTQISSDSRYGRFSCVLLCLLYSMMLPAVSMRPFQNPASRVVPRPRRVSFCVVFRSFCLKDFCLQRLFVWHVHPQLWFQFGQDFYCWCRWVYPYHEEQRRFQGVRGNFCFGWLGWPGGCCRFLDAYMLGRCSRSTHAWLLYRTLCCVSTLREQSYYRRSFCAIGWILGGVRVTRARDWTRPG